MNSAQFGLGFMVGFGTLTAGGVALAQTATKKTSSTTTAATTAPIAVPATAEPAPAQGMTLPGATPYPAADATDHAGVVGHFGVGFMGLRGLTLPGAGGLVTQGAPVIGVRYWLDPRMGIDAGLGLRFSGGSANTPSYNIAIAHIGVPLALAGSKHFSFQVIPEANLGYGTTDFGGPTTKDFHLDLGARAGAEVQFGFIGIPELGLQGGIGLGLNYDRFSAGGASSHTLAFGTSVGDSPWQIFTGNIAALYYFD